MYVPQRRNLEVTGPCGSVGGVTSNTRPVPIYRCCWEGPVSACSPLDQALGDVNKLDSSDSSGSTPKESREPVGSQSKPVDILDKLISQAKNLSSHVSVLSGKLKSPGSQSMQDSSNLAYNCQKPLQETPLARPGRLRRMVTCHGCHGPVGQGQHQGSELGKIKCKLPHSLYCRGGVCEDESWKACPPGYQYNPSIELANNVEGFENTLHSYEFQSQYSTVTGFNPAFSTPAQAIGQGFTADHHLPTFPSSERRISQEERFPSRIGFSDNQGLTPSNVPDSRQSPRPYSIGQ